ncbi:MAG: hypothetical protein WA208_02280, partial [Thermoanaerobaculia bacterium]
VPTESRDALRASYDTALADLRQWQGDPAVLERARTAFTQLVNRDRNFPLGYVGLARTEYYAGFMRARTYDQGPLDKAWKYVNHALKLDPQCYDAHLASSYISMARGDYDIARDSLASAAEIDPASPRHTLAQAHLAEREEEVAESMRLARDVVARSQDPIDVRQARQILIGAYGLGGQLEEADAEHREILKLDPKGAWSHGNYAQFLLARDDIDGAVREAEAAVAITPYPIAVNTLARALLIRARREWDDNQVAVAGRTLERVAELAKDDPETYAGLGGFYEGAAIRAKDPSMRTRALEWYEKALALSPDDPELQKVVARLKRSRA